MIEAASKLYQQAELAIASEEFQDASLLFSQADKMYKIAEDLEAIIIEQGEINEQ